MVVCGAGREIIECTTVAARKYNATRRQRWVRQSVVHHARENTFPTGNSDNNNEMQSNNQSQPQAVE